MPPGLETAFLGFLTFVAGQVILKLMDPALEPKKLIGRVAVDIGHNERVWPSVRVPIRNWSDSTGVKMDIVPYCR